MQLWKPCLEMTVWRERGRLVSHSSSCLGNPSSHVCWPHPHWVSFAIWPQCCETAYHYSSSFCSKHLIVLLLFVGFLLSSLNKCINRQRLLSYSVIQYTWQSDHYISVEIFLKPSCPELPSTSLRSNHLGPGQLGSGPALSGYTMGDTSHGWWGQEEPLAKMKMLPPLIMRADTSWRFQHP